MPLAQSVLPEFDHEMANTRKTLARVPVEKFDWRPHPKSYSLGDLTTHIANLPSWGAMTIEQDHFDLAPEGAGAPHREPVTSVDEALTLFDGHVAKTRAAIEGAADDRLMGPWSLLHGGETVFTLPRIAVLRSFMMNHLIHHRAQLGLYLRMNDVPMPALYGPSADEA